MRFSLIACGMLAALLLGAVIVTALPPKHHQLTAEYSYQQYLKDFGKAYATNEEHTRRQKNFAATLKMILAHNSDKTQTWKMGVNHMSDWTDGERAALRKNLVHHDTQPTRVHSRSAVTLPHTVDYRMSQPAVLTAVKDQGMCGSCWAHAATEEVETMTAIATGKLFVLSQEQINDCTPNPMQCGGQGGCQGSTYQLAWAYTLSNGGLAQEWVYPYTSYTGVNNTCKPNLAAVKVATVTGYVEVAKNDQSALQDAIATAGPVAIGVDASAWSSYESGIFSGCDYGKNISIDHAVQLVGYGHDYTTGLDYWVVRNSWSPAWGEEGFIRLQRDAQAGCGWNVDNREGLGCKNSPNTVWACGRCGMALAAAYPLV